MLRFVVALASEARPIAGRYRMRAAAGGGPFRVFAAPGDDAWLIVSGMGKAAAAAATAYLHLLAGGAPGRVWLNVGIGGHCHGCEHCGHPFREGVDPAAAAVARAAGRYRSLAVGDAVLAHKITDRGSGISWYPQLVIDSPLPAAAVLTADQVEREYAPPWVYDMEASGFFPTACRFSTAELVHACKVISDSPAASVTALSVAAVEELIAGCLEPVERLAGELAGLARGLADLAADPPGYREALARWHFTASERRRLQRLLRRLAVLAPGSDGADGAGGADDPLGALAAGLNDRPPAAPAAGLPEAPEPPRASSLPALEPASGARPAARLLRALEARLEALPVRLRPAAAPAP
ncbi:MAG TPA: hypothetical protein VHQ90_04735 [Thermoanaerobaculia bacterium]|nr:hypothetical protein [Thermoanaerobaculia bacterium]